ncbi:MAG TPA: hypothetical protein VF508_11325, partial [Pyrinomonadaceae bacterium]
MDVEELEARFREMDEREQSEPLNVDLEGDTESSANLTVSAERKVSVDVRGADDSDRGTGPGEKVESKTLLDVNLGD